MQGENKILLSTAYLPNIQYFSKLLSYQDVSIEVWDNYQKQSYRNRTSIYGANGKQDLIIPVKRPQGNDTKTRDVELDYDMPWQQVHWKALRSAYKHSPFFDIFEPELAPVFQKKFKYLLDWNFTLLNTMLTMTGFSTTYTKTKEYIYPDENTYDYRESIHPKKRMQIPDPNFSPFPYFQVFGEKHGFISNLSFIDLLFNEGPQAIYLCKKFIKNNY